MSYPRILSSALIDAGFTDVSVRQTTGGCRHERRPVLIGKATFGDISMAFDVIQEADQWWGWPFGCGDATGIQVSRLNSSRFKNYRISVDRGRGWARRFVDAVLDVIKAYGDGNE